MPKKNRLYRSIVYPVGIGLISTFMFTGIAVKGHAQTKTAQTKTMRRTNLVEQIDSQDKLVSLDFQKINQALSEGNYELWKTEMEKTKKGRYILYKIDSEAKFEKFRQAKEAFKSGNKSKAESILDDLGIKPKAFARFFNHKV